MAISLGSPLNFPALRPGATCQSSIKINNKRGAGGGFDVWQVACKWRLPTAVANLPFEDAVRPAEPNLLGPIDEALLGLSSPS